MYTQGMCNVDSIINILRKKITEFFAEKYISRYYVPPSVVTYLFLIKI